MNTHARSKAIAILFPILLGSVAGLLSSFLFSRSTSGAGKEEHPTHIALTTDEKAVPPSALRLSTRHRDERLTLMEQRLEEMENRDESAPAAAPEIAGAPETPEEERANDEAHFASQLRSHEGDNRHAEWAEPMSVAVRDELASLAEQGKFNIVNVDCRASSCVATLEWVSYAEATANISLLGHHIFDLGASCAKTMFVPEPTDKDQPYRGSLLFHSCSAHEAKPAD